MLPRALAVAQKLAEKAPSAVRLAKALLNASDAQTTTERILKEGEIFTARLQSLEVAEAFGAFFEKRKPVFKGR